MRRDVALRPSFYYEVIILSRYIYHIIRGNEIYVGQADRNEGPADVQGRLMEHFVNTYGKAKELDSSVPLIKKGLFQDIVLHVYEDDNYGLSEECYETFFAMWNPGIGKTKSRRKFKEGETEKTFTIKVEKEQDLVVSDFDKLNAAEIMHSVIMQLKGYKIVGKSMGGQNMATFLNTKDNHISLTKNTSPSQALAILSKDWNAEEKNKINNYVQNAINQFWSNHLDEIAQIYISNEAKKELWYELKRFILEQLRNIDYSEDTTVQVRFNEENFSKALNNFIRKIIIELKKHLDKTKFESVEKLKAEIIKRLENIEIELWFPTGQLLDIKIETSKTNFALWTKYPIIETNVATEPQYVNSLKHISSNRMNYIAKAVGKTAKNQIELSSSVHTEYKRRNIYTERWSIYFWDTIRTTDFWKNFNVATTITNRGKVRAVQRDRLPESAIRYY